MAKCPKCNKEFEPCCLCRGQYPHQQCVDDDICHECFMIENPNGRLGITNAIHSDRQSDVADEIWTNEDESTEIERQIIEDARR